MVPVEQAVNLGEVKYGREDDVLVCFGLGSCVGVVLFDPLAKIGGMAHIVLPTNGRQNLDVLVTATLAPKPNQEEKTPAKCADQGLPYLLENLLTKGASRSRLQAKIAGGASVLAVPIFNKTGGSEIGERNVLAVEVALENLKIPITAKDTGGNQGRTMRFYLEDGRVEISAFGLGKKLL